MRAPTGLELMLAVVALAVFGLMKLDAHTAAGREAELRSIKSHRVELQRENEALRDRMDQVDRAAADSLKRLNLAIEDAEARAEAAATAGRETFEEIVESVPDSMPELRALIERREQEHEDEVQACNCIIEEERAVSAVLRGQLTARDTLIVGLERDVELANTQIGLLEDLKHPGLSNLEAFSLGAGGYLVTTEVLGGTTLEGVVAGGVTYLITKGGSKLLRWIF